MKVPGLKAVIVFAILTLTIFSSVQSYTAEKSLIIYFSETGNTKAVCEALQKALAADILK